MASVSASVLMLDFGPTTPTGAALTNSPYHSVNGAFTDTHWNVLGASNVASGLIYSDGSAAEGVSLVLGASVGSTLVDFSRLPTHSSALGGSTGINNVGSVFAGSSVGKDGIFTSAPAGDNLVALKIGGLSAGRYEIYAVGANTSQSLNAQPVMAYFAAATGNIATFETNGLTASATSQLSLTSIMSWSEGSSYGKMTIDLADGDYFVLAIDALGAGAGAETRGFMNAIQIVSIPEPSAAVLGIIALFGLPLFSRVGRSKR